MIVYKFTDELLRTHGGYQYVVGVESRIAPELASKGALCGPCWLHAYEHPLIAEVMYRTHTSFDSPVLWRAEAPDEPVKRDGQVKLGVVAMTLLERHPVPVITHEQRVRFAIYCAQAVLPEKAAWKAKWSAWADDWLSGKDRTKKAAYDAAYYAYAAYADDAAYAATYDAAYDAAYATAYAAYADDDAYAATYAARKNAHTLDLLSLIERAMADEPA
jgi:hypothetical protein